MSLELTEYANGRDSNETRDTLFLLGGAAMVVFLPLFRALPTAPAVVT